MKIGFLSLGCPKNLVDGEVMLGIAREAGHEITADADRGRRARREHLRVHRHREAGIDRRDPRDGRAEARRPCKRLVVTGCLAERYRDELQQGDSRDRRRARHRRSAGDSRRDRRSGPALALGRRRSEAVPLQRSARRPLSRCVSADVEVGAAPEARAPSPRAPTLPTYIYDADTPRLLTTPRHFAYVKVAEGLRLHVRVLHHPDAARHVSQPDDDSIVREARALAERGVRELLLISQDTTSTASIAASAARWRGCCAS